MTAAAGAALLPFLSVADGRAQSPQRTGPGPTGDAGAQPVLRAIPSTGERIPVIGMGTWITFNVGESETLRRDRLAVLRTFFERGGGMVDSSPMYGSSQDVVGWCLARLEDTDGLLSADKIWTSSDDEGREQLSESRALWGVDRFDVMQVHNLINWEAHLDMLREAKAAGKVRYVGITTSHGSRHREMERIMEREEIDFVQLTYNVVDRKAEDRLLPLAAERRLGVIVNRPFRGGRLFRTYEDNPLPDWAGEIGCENWAQVFLKFIVSHPSVTCAIPATSRVDHMTENMGALYGDLPDAAFRRRMADHVARL